MPVNETEIQQFSERGAPPSKLPSAAEAYDEGEGAIIEPVKEIQETVAAAVQTGAEMATQAFQTGAKLMEPQGKDAASLLESLPTQFTQAESLARNQRYWDTGPAIGGNK